MIKTWKREIKIGGYNQRYIATIKRQQKDEVQEKHQNQEHEDQQVVHIQSRMKLEFLQLTCSKLTTKCVFLYLVTKCPISQCQQFVFIV